MSQAAPRRRPVRLTIGVFVCVFVALSWSSSRDKSATWDEPIHLVLGYAALTRGDYRLDPEHPPFVRMFAALPLLAMPGTTLDTSFVDRSDPASYARTVSPVAKKFLYFDNDSDRLLRAGRFMIALLGAGLGVLLFAWAYEWLGWWPAVTSLVFYSLEPNVLAHSTLVTTDIGCATFFFGTLYFLWRSYRHRRRRDIVVSALFLALALASKFSALTLLPIAVIALIAVGWKSSRRRVLVSTGLVGAFLLTSWMGLWIVYRCRYSPIDRDSWRYEFQYDEQVRTAVPALTSAVAWVDRYHLLPNAYVQGLLFGAMKAATRPSFLAGQYSSHGWWYYFPVAFLIKTPISLLLLIAIGGVAAIARATLLGVDTLLFVLGPPAIYLAIAMMMPLNIGVRHILPIYPFLMLLGAAGVAMLLERATRSRRMLVAAMVCGSALELATVYPSTLTFFNVFVGGPSRGEQFLVDSNLDWGQDLKPLKAWMDAQGISYINLAYFGTADPAYYHIDRTDLPGSDFFIAEAARPPRLPGYVAVSATILNGVYFNDADRHFYSSLRGVAPLTTIGNSIHVYWVERPWW